MNESDAITAEQHAQSAFSAAQARWREALQAHRMAPPDLGFSARLAELAAAARQEAAACREAHSAGFQWPPHRAADSGPPYELRAGTGRRGPAQLWSRFDAAAAHLSRVAAGSDLLAVADAYEELAGLADALAAAVQREDRSRGRSRRSA